MEQQHLDLDYRTFSRRIVADSKALERLEGRFCNSSALFSICPSVASYGRI
ncbi:hypothetical protein HFO42_12565 [Rhizobium leguminosarum]|uniref:Uncharacterized protein n=1 Tax=Rhizobium leguminosarum TaxID=384 RepID=A0AAJ1EE59_RHILE|nr:hypothetical protein [Rhizobium leguminosarum]MBY5534935.1 hypothetical protein [Rhizobium leguminosarum]MBY5562846.1 hypothetical protein [Rhizobium leguminosarum]MBY5598637.1 hypothetical protein [Rhizobium leguminosarum]MBY5615745.1 hypothetical protein [Rhizobium leguminosarum]MBY5628931.1 hypothetical protein [Rhizobium leguminosarum]